MRERIRFIHEWEKGDLTMAGVCRKYGVSRPTGHKWIQRYLEIEADTRSTSALPSLASPCSFNRSTSAAGRSSSVQCCSVWWTPANRQVACFSRGVAGRRCQPWSRSEVSTMFPVAQADVGATEERRLCAAAQATAKHDLERPYAGFLLRLSPGHTSTASTDHPREDPPQDLAGRARAAALRGRQHENLRASRRSTEQVDQAAGGALRR